MRYDRGMREAERRLESRTRRRERKKRPRMAVHGAGLKKLPRLWEKRLAALERTPKRKRK